MTYNVLDSMLTTFDNPYNPYTQFNEWYNFDTINGYNTCAYLARISGVSFKHSNEENKSLFADAIEEVLKFDLTNRYLRVNKENSESIIEKIRKNNKILIDSEE